ncbi:MAG: hypothetical protein ACSLFB_13365 [Acidimicrobiales bacterium]
MTVARNEGWPPTAVRGQRERRSGYPDGDELACQVNRTIVSNPGKRLPWRAAVASVGHAHQS